MRPETITLTRAAYEQLLALADENERLRNRIVGLNAAVAQARRQRENARDERDAAEAQLRRERAKEAA